ncbi:MAG: phosphoribulokinase [Deltaproteobacteria bacterium]|nr:phosphoribulokinase [Deltaproteobacteria bacterium]
MKRNRPIILGIVGDSAAGKTTITGGLRKLLGHENVTEICTDDYHKYDRKERSIHKITALHPDCNYLDIMELQLERLHYGQPILKPVYDHDDGTLTRPEYVTPREYVIIEGLLGYYTPPMRNFYDIKVYLAPPEDLRMVWKIKRDCSKRGYTEDQVRDEMVKREPDSEAFIRPQRKFADIIIEFYPKPGVDLKDAGPNLNVRLILRPTIPHPDISYLADNKDAHEAGIRFKLGRDSGMPVDILEIDGDVTPEHARELEKRIWDHLPELEPINPDQFGKFMDAGKERHSDPLAITQLLLTYHLLREYEGNTVPFAPPVAAMSRLKGPGK